MKGCLGCIYSIHVEIYTSRSSAYFSGTFCVSTYHSWELRMQESGITDLSGYKFFEHWNRRNKGESQTDHLVLKEEYYGVQHFWKLYLN